MGRGTIGKAPGGPKIKQLGGGGIKKNAKAALKVKSKLLQKGGRAPMTLAQVIPKATVPKPPPTPAGRHTILLQQPAKSNSSRTWSTYSTLMEAVDSFISSYEAKLRSLNPAQKQLSYTVADVHKYIDGMHDMSMMVFDPQTTQYAPRGKPFLKSQIMNRLKGAAK